MGLLDWIFGRGKKASQAPVAGPAAFAVIDVETTGLSPSRDRVLELAIVRMDSAGMLVDRWSSRFHPDRPVGATEIHGITDADVADAPRFVEVAPSVAGMLQGVVVVAHNASFDVSFLRREFERAGWELPLFSTYCTLEASKHYFPQLTNRRLADCCNRMGISLRGAHSALGDATATSELLKRYLGRGLLADTPPFSPHHALSAPLGSTLPPGAPRPATTASRQSRAIADAEADRVAAAGAPTLLEKLVGDPTWKLAATGLTPEESEYLGRLHQTLKEDGFVSSRRRKELIQLADDSGIDRATRRSIHEAFIDGLARAVVEPGIVPPRERDKLSFYASTLDVEQDFCTGALKNAEAERLTRLNAKTRPLPPGWAHGEPLRIGDRIAFTGDTHNKNRSTLKAAAVRKGLRVTSSVSSRTVLLVWDGEFQGNKYDAALQHGTRIVSPQDYDVLLRHLQPAPPKKTSPRTTAPAEAREEPASPAPMPAPAPRQAHDPAEIRAWARANGLPVSNRGRLSAELIRQYQESVMR